MNGSAVVAPACHAVVSAKADLLGRFETDARQETRLRQGFDGHAAVATTEARRMIMGSGRPEALARSGRPGPIRVALASGLLS